MGLDVALLKTSFEVVLDREPNLTRRFYEHLFLRHPEVRPMFHRSPRATQERMLTDALVALIDHLEDAPWLVEKLGAMGAKHAGYGVTTEMYAWVGDALLATLADVAGADWTDDLARAWGEAYRAIASMMQNGATQAATSP